MKNNKRDSKLSSYGFVSTLCSNSEQQISINAPIYVKGVFTTSLLFMWNITLLMAKGSGEIRHLSFYNTQNYANLATAY